MSIAPTADIVHLWTDSGTPTRFVWHQRRCRVIAAEHLRASVAQDALTHPAERLVGWSLVGAADQNPTDVRVMRVRSAGSGWVRANVGPA